MPKNNRRPNIETHPDRAEIEARLCRRVPLRTLASRYDLDIATLSRHHKRLREQRPKTYAALEAKDWSCTVEELERIKTETSEGFIVKLKSQIDKLIGAQDRAFESGNFEIGANLAYHVNANMQMLGELSGCLKHTVQSPRPRIKEPVLVKETSAVKAIVEAVGLHFDITPDDVLNGRVIRARHLAMWLARRRTRLSFPDLGRLFGDCHHTTVVFAVKKIQAIAHTELAADLAAIATQIGLSEDALKACLPNL